MKKLLFTLAFAAAATISFAKDQYDIRPDAAKESDAPTAVAWQNANDKALAEKTSDETLAAFVADEVSALALLARIKGAYATDPFVMCQVGAVSQWVMMPDAWYCLFWDGEHEAGRKVWVPALLKTAEDAKDTYVKMVCLDQLRWCGCQCPCVQARIQAIGEKSGDKSVRDFAAVVVRELSGKSIGL